MDVDYSSPFRGHAARDSIAESLSESLISNPSNNPRSQDGEEDLPWRVGPTPTPAFMRRPDTRVYYTSSADVADLIDQLSSDLAGAARGRIDIRPTSPGGREYGIDEDAAQHQQSIAGRLDEGLQMSQNHQNHQHLQNHPSLQNDLQHQVSREAYEPGQFSDAPSPLNVPLRRDASLRPPDAHHAYTAGMLPNSSGAGPVGAGSGGQHVGSPGGASWTGSDISSPETSVQDRLQALMDRLRSAPGGVGRAG